MKLRSYQQKAIEKTIAWLNHNDGSPVVVMPTGSGKTPVMTEMAYRCANNGNRVLILAHVKELLQQTYDRLFDLLSERTEDGGLGIRDSIGLFSAGLGCTDSHQPIIVAGVQSIYRKMNLFDPPFDLIMIDEAHAPPIGDDPSTVMYRTLMGEATKANPDVRLIGFTATPYRTGQGRIYGKANGYFADVAAKVTIKECLDGGFLCPLITENGTVDYPLDSLAVDPGHEFNELAMSAVFDNDIFRIEKTIDEIRERTKDRKRVLIFCASVSHAAEVHRQLKGYGLCSALLVGEDTDDYRSRIVDGFKNGPIKYLVNVNLFTTGFDAREVDCVVLLRATNSPGLYYQMLGRGLRIHEAKVNCLILDYGKNIDRHGPIDKIKIVEPLAKRGMPTAKAMRECPECEEPILFATTVCPACGVTLTAEPEPMPEPELDPRASKLSPIEGGEEEEEEEDDGWRRVHGISYAVHVKKSATPGTPRTMRVSYKLSREMFGASISEWVCVEHEGFAREKACGWWRRRSDSNCPEDAENAVEIAGDGMLRKPSWIRVEAPKKGESFPRIIDYDFSEPQEIDEEYDESEDERIPF